MTAQPMTTLWVSKVTKMRFVGYGRKGETDDQLLNWMIDRLAEANLKKIAELESDVHGVVVSHE